MARTKADAKAPETPAVPQWTHEQLMAVKHLGPAIIGPAMYAAAQELATTTNNGVFGPALLGVIPDAYKDQRTLAKAEA